MIKGRLLSTRAMLKAFSSEHFSPVEKGPQNGGFWGEKRRKAQLLVLRPPKGTSLRGTPRVEPPTLIISAKFEVDLTIYCVAGADTLRDLVTLTF